MKNKLSKISHIFLLFLFILPLSSINNIYAQVQESISTTKTEYLTNDDDVAPIILNNRNDNSEYKWEISSKDIIDKTKYHYRPTFQAKNIEDIQNRINLNNTECSPEYQEIPNINKNISINPILSSARINISSVVYCYRLKIINNNNVSYSNVIKTIQYRENKIFNITNNQRLLSNLSQSTNNSQIIIDQQPIYDRFDNKCHYDLLPLEIKAHLSDEDIPEGKGLTYQWQRVIYNYQINSNENYIDIQGATEKTHIPDISATSNLQMYLYRVKISNSNQYIYSDTALRYRCPQDKINEDSNREYIAKLPFLYLNIKTEWKGTENQLKMQLLNNYNTPEEMKNSVYNENLTFNISVNNNNNISIPLRDIIIEGIYYNSFNQYDDQFLIKIKNRETAWTENNNTRERSTPTLDAIYERVKENRVGRVGKDKGGKANSGECLFGTPFLEVTSGPNSNSDNEDSNIVEKIQIEGVQNNYHIANYLNKNEVCNSFKDVDKENPKQWIRDNALININNYEIRSHLTNIAENITDYPIQNQEIRKEVIADNLSFHNRHLLKGLFDFSAFVLTINPIFLLYSIYNLFLAFYIHIISIFILLSLIIYFVKHKNNKLLTLKKKIFSLKNKIKSYLLLIKLNFLKKKKNIIIIFIMLCILLSYLFIDRAKADAPAYFCYDHGIAIYPSVVNPLIYPMGNIYKKYNLCDLSVDYGVLETSDKYFGFLHDLYKKGFFHKESFTDEELQSFKNKLYELKDRAIYENNQKSIIGNIKNIFIENPDNKYINTYSTSTLEKAVYYWDGRIFLATGTPIYVNNTKIINYNQYDKINLFIFVIIFSWIIFYFYKKNKLDILKNKDFIIISSGLIIMFIFNITSKSVFYLNISGFRPTIFLFDAFIILLLISPVIRYLYKNTFTCYSGKVKIFIIILIIFFSIFILGVISSKLSHYSDANILTQRIIFDLMILFPFVLILYKIIRLCLFDSIRIILIPVFLFVFLILTSNIMVFDTRRPKPPFSWNSYCNINHTLDKEKVFIGNTLNKYHICYFDNKYFVDYEFGYLSHLKEIDSFMMKYLTKEKINDYIIKDVAIVDNTYVIDGKIYPRDVNWLKGFYNFYLFAHTLNPVILFWSIFYFILSLYIEILFIISLFFFYLYKKNKLLTLKNKIFSLKNIFKYGFHKNKIPFSIILILLLSIMIYIIIPSATAQPRIALCYKPESNIGSWLPGPADALGPLFDKYNLCDLPGIDYKIIVSDYFSKTSRYSSFYEDIELKGLLYKKSLTNEELKYIKNKLYELQDRIIYEENKKSIIGKTKNLFLKDPKEKYINSTGTITLSKDYHPNGMEDNKIASGTQIEITNTEIIDTGKYNIKNIIILLSFIIFTSSLFYLHKKKKINVNIIKNRKVWVILFLVISILTISYFSINKTSASEIGTCLPSSGAIDGALPLPNEYIFKKYGLCDLSGIDYNILEVKGYISYRQFLFDLYSKGYIGSQKSTLTNEELKYIKNKLYELQDQIIYEENKKSIIGKTKNLFLKDPKEKYINSTGTITLSKDYHPNGMEENKIASGTQIEITNTEIIDTGKYNIKNIIILLSFIIFTSFLFYLHKKKKINVNIIKNRKVWMILFLVIAILTISYFSINKTSASEITSCLKWDNGPKDQQLPLPNWHFWYKYNLCNLPGIDYYLLEGTGRDMYIGFLFDLYSKGYISENKSALSEEELKYIKNKLYELQDRIIYENNQKSIIGKVKNVFIKNPDDKYLHTTTTTTITQDIKKSRYSDRNGIVASGTQISIINTTIVDDGRYNKINIFIFWIIISLIIFYLYKKNKLHILKNKDFIIISSGIFVTLFAIPSSIFVIPIPISTIYFNYIPLSVYTNDVFFVFVVISAILWYLYERYLSHYSWKIKTLSVIGIFVVVYTFLFAILSDYKVEIYLRNVFDIGQERLSFGLLLFPIVFFLYKIIKLCLLSINLIKNKKILISSLVIFFFVIISFLLISNLSAQEPPLPIDDLNVINNNPIIEIDPYSPTLNRTGLGYPTTTGTHIPVYDPACCVEVGTATKEFIEPSINLLSASNTNNNPNIRLATVYTAPTFSGLSAVLGSNTYSGISFTIYSSESFSQYQIDCGLTSSNMTISTGLINILSTNSKVVDLSLFQPNTTYYCKARISNVYSSWSPYSNIITITTRLRLIQPLFTITQWSGEEVGIVINKNVGATPFSEYYINCNGSQLVWANTNPSNLLYYPTSHIPLTPNTNYNCYVKIIQPGYDWSLPVYTTFTTSNALAYPAIQASNITSNGANFTISKRGNIGFDQHNLTCSNSSGHTISDTDNNAGWDNSSNTVTLSGLQSGSTYTCKVKIRNENNDYSNWSNTLNITTLSVVPAITTGFWLPANGAGDGWVSLRWDNAPASENVTSYTIQYTTDTFIASSPTITIYSPNTSGTVTGLTNNIQYKFRIRSNNAAGSSPWTSIVVYATPSFPEYTSNSPDYWNRTAINADNAYNSLTTTEKNNLSNIVVGVIDSGIDIFHPDFWDDIDNDCPAWAFTNNIRNMDNYVSSRDAKINCNFDNSNIYKNGGESGVTNKIGVSGVCTPIPFAEYRKEDNGCDDDGNGYIDDTFGANFGSNNSSGNNYLRIEHQDNDKERKGHGTGVSSVIAAKGNNNKGIIGIAPDVKIFSVRAIDVGENSYPISISRVIDDFVLTKDIKIINRSYGQYIELNNINQVYQTENWHKELNNSNRNKIVSVTANGNYNQSLSIMGSSTNDLGFAFPVSYNESINTGSSNKYSNNTNDFSNYGNITDIIAPGDCVLMLFPTNLSRNGNCNEQRYDTKYVKNYGTSLSAPHITGVVALMKAVNPNLTREQVRQILHNSGTDIGINGQSKPSYQGVNANCIYRVGFDDCSGYGLINAYTAVQLARAENNTPYFITPFIYSPRTGDTLSDINSASSSIIISIDNAPNIQSYKISIQKNATGTNYENIIPATNTQWIDVKTDNTIRNALSLSTTTIDLSTIQNGLENGLYTIRIQAINWNGDTFEHYVSGVKIEKSNPCGASLSVRYNSVNICNSAPSTRSISGSISYYASSTKSISGAQISLTNTDNNTLVSTTTTNNTGAYTFNNVTTGANYNISVSYTSSSSTTGININDNVRNAQIIVGTYTPTEDAKISADTNQDGIIDINDNVKNAQIIVGTYQLPIPFIFIPTDKINLNATSTENSITKKNYLWPSYQSKTITNLNSDTTINFKGYKVGDSNGDWR